ncbi:helix-turn-helix transcriptional regulator [Clostridium sp.]|uniref:helix-turn-helix transcriptional regulator n=1 Tax=Clostridium sp. TaxID=1506 RepID=UPI00283F3E49|nr:helix-turn-helix transcriptional regulator [Clostridium sp.]MDR3594041.1 helix-turn-helix transcriptional regulator [Clostridium sp.]
MEKQRYKELGDFLKTRRAKISPSQVGISEGLRRRTPGLRREEVANIAGIGLTWYTWLEQGRPIQVSAEVLESLSRVLMLNGQERIHLYTLARQVLPAEIPSYQENVSPILQHALDNLILSPSFIMDTRWNIIAWNKAASAVFIDFNKIHVSERNMISMMFTYDEYKKLFIDWESHAKGMLARFRSTSGEYIEDPWLVKFIEDLKRKSEEFNLWWSQHDVQRNGETYKKLKHPIVGELFFEFISFDVSDGSNLRLIVNTPFSKSDTDIKVKSLLDKRGI